MTTWRWTTLVAPVGVAVAVVVGVGGCGGVGSDAARVPDSVVPAEARTAPSVSTTTTDRPTPATSVSPPTRPPAPTTTRTGLPAGEDTTIERVVDGDTVVVAGGVRVRLIGIDTPETVDPRRPVECFGREASRRASELLPPGTPVRLVFDVERYDRYDRTLAYVYRRSDSRFVNEVMVREGYALAYTVPPNVAHADDFARWQAEARTADRGLWAACPAGGGSPAPSAAGGCDAAYPDVCIPPPPPDLDCADVTPRRFRVVPPDPHRFDGDGDGVGCES